jgi:glycosyltransferase involved in cell wall biosynthesis
MSPKQKTATKCILVDAREFVPGKLTGIGRVLEGLIDALAESDTVQDIIIATGFYDAVPPVLKNREKIKISTIPPSFFQSEKLLSDLTKNGVSVFISPYPKLPFFGCHCGAIHTVHDVLDLTHPAYRKRHKVLFDGFRLRMALRKADLTWYDSIWSKEETRKYAGYAGENAKVRYPGVNKIFNPERQKNEDDVLKKYRLKPGYILVLGNGLPHKNLGVLLEISDQISKELVFVGVSQDNQAYWKSQYQKVAGVWIKHVMEEDLPAIVRGAFCLAQPSTAEGYGYPPLEAMACGVPAVVSNIPVLVETTGGKVFIADPQDCREWIQALKALEKQDIHQNQIEKGFKWIKPLWGRKGWQQHIADIEELLKTEYRRQ